MGYLDLFLTCLNCFKCTENAESSGPGVIELLATNVEENSSVCYFLPYCVDLKRQMHTHTQKVNTVE